jgi:putative nucleotidyltransferase with HDIG domain
VVLFCVAAGIVAAQHFYVVGGHGFTVESPSPRTYRAVSPIHYIDTVTMDVLRGKAGEAVVGVVVRDAGAAERMKTRLAELRNVRDWSSPVEGFPDELSQAFLGLQGDRRNVLFSYADSVGDAYFEALASGDAAIEAKDREMLWAEIEKLSLPRGEENLLYQLLEEVIVPSYKVDPQLTELARGVTQNSIPPVERRLEAGDVIVEQGRTITPPIARMLRLQGYSEDKFPLKRLVLLFFLMLALPFWLEISAGEKGDRPTWSCVVFVFLVGWAGEMVSTHWGAVGAGLLASTTVAYLCIPRRLAFSVCLAETASLAFLPQSLSIYSLLSLLVLGFLTVMAGFYVLHKVTSREDLAYRVFLLALCLAITRVPVHYLQGFPITAASLRLGWPLGETWHMWGLFLIFELGTTFLAVSVLPMVEGAIGALSILRTRELSHPSSPLLRKLQNEAPGTYHHSLMIGALAEAVANELGMDENLMKVGAYYHDIGKLYRPNFFVENQMGGKNIHDTLSPTLSAVAIIAHVREGIELAKEFGLPKQVKNFIIEHHGTTSLGYFYKKAQALGENVDFEQFCYPGPKPQSRETALLMLLDSLEAAMRSEIKNITSAKDIQEVIERVVAGKIAAKQMDDVDFTFREMRRIEGAIMKTFQSMYHTRTVKEIKLPDAGGI